MECETTVIIVGAGPAGLATSACLNLQNIPNIVLEKEDCYASLWRKRVYDRLKLHLAKQFCELPHMPFPPNAPTYVSRNGFIQYLDDYVSHFGINPLCQRVVESASFDQELGKWVVVAENGGLGCVEKWVARFLVVATGENSEGYIPPIPGLDSFNGEVIHASSYRNGEGFSDREVLVVGSGNSGMEIAMDLSNWGARASIVVRNPVHIVDKVMVRVGMVMLKYVGVEMVDKLVVFLSKLKYGNLNGYGIIRPSKGPFFLKKETGRSPVIDLGTIPKIRARLIQVFPSVNKIDGNEVHFMDGQIKSFKAIIFATGYTSSVRKWLKGGEHFGEDGMPRKSARYHWKGENGLYCAGFSKTGLLGISNDAKAIANDIIAIMNRHNCLL